MNTFRRWRVRIICGIPTLLVVAASVVFGLQLRQDSLDDSLIKAVKALDAPTVERLLNEGANANARDNKEPPPTVAGLLSRVRAWLQGTPLPVTVDASVPALIVLLQDTDLIRTFHYRKDIPLYDTIAVALIKHHANVNVRCRHVDPMDVIEGVDLGVLFSEATPLHIAAIFQLKPTARLLLSHGAIVDSRNGVGCTPLEYADADTALLLLQHGADVNAGQNNGGTRLAMAVTWCDLKLVRVLIGYGANVSLPDGDGNSMLYLAEHCDSPGQMEILDLLRKHGARLNRKEKEALARRKSLSSHTPGTKTAPTS